MRVCVRVRACVCESACECVCMRSVCVCVCVSVCVCQYLASITVAGILLEVMKSIRAFSTSCCAGHWKYIRLQ